MRDTKIVKLVVAISKYSRRLDFKNLRFYTKYDLNSFSIKFLKFMKRHYRGGGGVTRPSMSACLIESKKDRT